MISARCARCRLAMVRAARRSTEPWVIRAIYAQNGLFVREKSSTAGPAALSFASGLSGALMPAHLRRVLLMAHIALSVSWIGAVGAFLALAILGQRSTDAVTVTSAYVAMNAISLFVVIPLSLCALISGMAMALLSPWGLIKHYWVLSKLTLTLLAAGMLMLHQFSAV